MTIWEFMACIDGYAVANGAKPKVGDMEDDRLADLGIEGF